MELIPRPIGGRITAIPSKSQAHRLLICAALADHTTKLVCPQRSKDIEATAACLEGLGAKCCYVSGAYHITPIHRADAADIDCGESGSTLRFLLPIVAALGIDTTFHLHGRLPERPLSPLWEELEAHGCTLSRPTADTIHCTGKLLGGTFRIAGNISSQFISGLLFALPLIGTDSDIMLTSAIESGSYIRMTLTALHSFSIATERTAAGWHIPSGQHYHATAVHSIPEAQLSVEGDWSNAAFWLCAGAISQPVTVTGLDPDSAQGDRAVLDILRRFGAGVLWENGSVTVSPKPLRATQIDASDIPDLVPPLALVASCAEGKTHIYGAARLRIKESDRLQSVTDTLNSLGGQAEILPDGLLIHGRQLTGGSVDACNDHRIAMLAAIASAVCTQSVQLSGAEAVSKSYPRFWEDFYTMQKEDL